MEGESIANKGAIIFYREGGHLLVLAGRQFFRELSFFTGRGASVCGGTRIFWGVQRGEPVFFFTKSKGEPEFLPVVKGGSQNLFTYAKREDQKKLATGNHRQTTPLPVKNDRSLMVLPFAYVK